MVDSQISKPLQKWRSSSILINSPITDFTFSPTVAAAVSQKYLLREIDQSKPQTKALVRFNSIPMARNLVVLALIFFSVLAAGVSAQSPTASPKSAPKSSSSSVPPPPSEEEPAPAPKESSYTAGASPESSPLAPASEYYSAVSTPPAPASVPAEGPNEFSFDEAAPAPSGANGLKVSAVAGVAAAVAGFGFLG